HHIRAGERPPRVMTEGWTLREALARGLRREARRQTEIDLRQEIQDVAALIDARQSDGVAARVLEREQVIGVRFGAAHRLGGGCIQRVVSLSAAIDAQLTSLIMVGEIV